ncbi:MAG: SPOR domain-containing protein [Bacteroidia bacterium]|nr:SPOR domain-containing protein [Bacteroidia bacterium]
MKHFYLIILLLAISLGQKAQVTMVTNMPPSVAPEANLTIEVKINKGTIGNFSKYEMEVPEGFTAAEGECRTGYFTFEKNRIKIVWVTIPAEAEFIISFKLKTPATNGPHILYQKFFYIENGTKKEVVGQQIDVKVAADGVTKTLSYLPEKPAEPAVTNTVAPVTNTYIPLTVTNSVQAIPTKTSLAVATTTIAASANTITTTSSNALITTQAGLTYLVQIGTFTSDPGKAKYADLGKVTVEKDGAVYKVLIGEYPSKEEALKKRDELVTKGYNGFLVKYQNGQRVK